MLFVICVFNMLRTVEILNKYVLQSIYAFGLPIELTMSVPNFITFSLISFTTFMAFSMLSLPLLAKPSIVFLAMSNIWPIALDGSRSPGSANATKSAGSANVSYSMSYGALVATYNIVDLKRWGSHNGYKGYIVWFNFTCTAMQTIAQISTSLVTIVVKRIDFVSMLQTVLGLDWEW